MTKRIWKDGKYREYPVLLSLEKEDALELRDLLWANCYPSNMDERLLKIIHTIDNQLKMREIKPKDPVECDFCPDAEELMRREREGYYNGR
jgi:hypothetical protein